MSKLIGLDGKPQAQQPQVSMLDFPNLKCTECEGILFQTLSIVKKISAVAVGAPHDQIAPIPVLVCVSCGEILMDSIPKGVL